MKKDKKLPVNASDLLIIAGVAITGTGIWQIYQPASLIFVGMCSLIAGILGLRQEVE